jgi:hypothetical protein
MHGGERCEHYVQVCFYDAFFTAFGFGWGSFTTFGENSPVTGFFVFPRILNLLVANVMTSLRMSYVIPLPARWMSFGPITTFGVGRAFPTMP